MKHRQSTREDNKIISVEALSMVSLLILYILAQISLHFQRELNLKAFLMDSSNLFSRAYFRIECV